MKKLISISVLLIFIASFSASMAENKPAKQVKTAVATNKIELYYFHYTRRCVTCNAVESETKASIAALYPAEYKKGRITFKSVNLDEDSSAPLAKKCKAEGQALLVISGANRTDFTDKGFMYAKSNPAKLKAELKKTIDSLL